MKDITYIRISIKIIILIFTEKDLNILSKIFTETEKNMQNTPNKPDIKIPETVPDNTARLNKDINIKIHPIVKHIILIINIIYSFS